ncbi:crossover junction endodeoxyribonuclease RuvC [bacterium]|nr:crossover junction endodeoxyribonuclease RuvC [bacterium]MBU1651161.1 crossover junction endodeoxyribonuclease RuvC [bacterium]MBU1881594.1 crossover junction endodeoxyribonuclease RuvC [bacterium]
MRIIGIDPGLTHTGVGIIEKDTSLAATRNGLIHIYTDLISPPKKELPKRLLVIYERIVEVIHRFGPAIMAVEDQFFGKNVQTAFKTGQARGAALLAAATCDIPVRLFAPARVKLAVVGNGNASKEQVRHMIGHILGITDLPKSLDCTDALAVAICQAFKPELGK